MAFKNKLRNRGAKDPQAEPRVAPAQPTVPIYETVADTLRNCREDFQLELSDVAHVLNIRKVYLQAIEAGEYGDLPGTTYAVGFVRAYSEYLGLDGDEMVRRFKDEERGLERQTELNFPTPVPESRLPSGALILISLVFLGLAYGGWSYVSSRNGEVADLIPEVPDRLMDLVGGDDQDANAPVAVEITPSVEPAPEPLESQAQVANAPVADTPGADAPIAVEAPSADLESESAAAPVPQPAEALLAPVEPLVPEPLEQTEFMASPPSPAPTAEQVAEQSAALDEAIPAAPTAPEIPAAPEASASAAAGQQVYGSEHNDSRVTLKASQDSWVQVRDGRNGLLMARVLRAGESYRVPNEPGITMVTGNAGGLEILVDGTSLGTMGPVGAVRRDVALEPALLLGSQPSTN
ncbi:MAG: RodZ domain-containing protein [Pseudomonadota bacterium]